jgi:hypothetical protein
MIIGFKIRDYILKKFKNNIINKLLKLIIQK